MEQEKIIFSENFVKLYRKFKKKDQDKLAYSEALYDFAKELYQRIPPHNLEKIERLLSYLKRKDSEGYLPVEKSINETETTFLLNLNLAMPNERYFKYSNGYIPMKEVWKILGPFSTEELLEKWHAVYLIKTRFDQLFSFLKPEIGLHLKFRRGYKQEPGFEFNISLAYIKQKNKEIIDSI